MDETIYYEPENESLTRTPITSTPFSTTRDRTSRSSARIADELLSIERTKNDTCSKELARRETQVNESAMIIKKLRSEINKLKEEIENERIKEKETIAMNKIKNELAEKQIAIQRLELKLKKKVLEMENWRVAMTETENRNREEVEEFKDQLMKSQTDLQDVRKEFSEHLQKCLNKNNVSTAHFSMSSSDMEHLEMLRQEIGSLRATKEFLERDKDILTAKITSLESDLSYAKADTNCLKSANQELEKELAELENTHKEIGKIKDTDNEKLRGDRIEIRTQLLTLRNEHKAFIEKHKNCAGDKSALDEMKIQLDSLENRLKVAEANVARLTSEKEELTKNILEIERNAVDWRNQFEALSIASETVEKQEVDKNSALQKEVLRLRKKFEESEKAVSVIDGQCEQIAERYRAMKEDKKAKAEEFALLSNELRLLKQKEAEFRDAEIECERLQKDNGRLRRQIDEMEADHDSQIKNINMMAKRSGDIEASESEKEMKARFDLLEKEKYKNEGLIKRMTRELDDLKKALEDKDNKLMLKECDLDKEKTKYDEIFNGLKIAIEKGETFKKNISTLEDLIASKDATIAESKTKYNELESELFELHEQVEQKDKLVAYLQSQIQVKQLPKLKYTGSNATLISTSDYDIGESSYIKTKENSYCSKKSNQKKNNSRVLNDMNITPYSSNISEKYTAITPSKLPDQSPIDDEVPKTPKSVKRQGTMRHSIPHRWKLFFAIKQVKCYSCSEGLSRLRYANRCVDCGCIVHVKCTDKMEHNCGLPVDCAKYYTEAKSENGMEGWVQFYAASDPPQKRDDWKKCYAKLSNGVIKFFDEQSFSSDAGEPFFTVELMVEKWRIYQQSGPPVSGVQNESMKRLIEIKLSGFNMFLLVPTDQSKLRWLKALQTVSHRMQLQSKPKANGTECQMILSLDAPQNLSVNATILFGDHLLVGANEGLFATELRNGRSPFNIIGVKSVHLMELIPELNMIIIVCGQQKQLSIISLSQLRSALINPRTAVNPTPVCNLINCHIMVASAASSDYGRYLYVATIDAIHVLQYKKNIDMFNPIGCIETHEPCNTILSISGGFVYASDVFYFVENRSLEERQIILENVQDDYPIAALFIGSNEILLAFHNYGVFVDLNGIQTRQPEEWHLAPLCFVCANGFLFIGHFESLEVYQIASLDNVQENTSSLKFVSEYRCSNVQFTGYGSTRKEVVFSLSSDTRVEIHKFSL